MIPGAPGRSHSYSARVLGALVGIAALGAAAWWLHVSIPQKSEAKSAKAISSSEEPRAPDTSASQSDFAAAALRVRSLEARLRELERKERAPAEEPPPEVPAEPSVISGEEAKKLVLERQAERERSFVDDPIDSAWAGPAKQAFQRDLGQLAASAEFSVLAVECKTTQCRAKVRWPSYEKAVQTWKAALHKSYEVNCGIEAFVPAPDDVSAPYETALYFDCTDERAN